MKTFISLITIAMTFCVLYSQELVVEGSIKIGNTIGSLDSGIIRWTGYDIVKDLNPLGTEPTSPTPHCIRSCLNHHR